MGYNYYDTSNGQVGDPISEKITINQGETQIERVFHLPWEDAIQYCKQAVGGWVMSPTGVLTAYPPFTYGYNFGTNNIGLSTNIELDCINAEITNFGKGCATTGEWIHAEVTLTYGNPKRLEAEIEMSLDVEEFVVKKQRVVVCSPGETDPNNSSKIEPAKEKKFDEFIKLMPTSDLSISWNLRPVNDPRNWRCAVGRVNDVCWNGFAAQTVLFKGVQTRRVINTTGQANNSTTYSFKIRYSGWNNVYDPEQGLFVPYRIGGVLKIGELKTRTNDTQGVINMPANIIGSGDGQLALPGNLNIWWDNGSKHGQRLAVTPIYSGNEITISNGSGTVLPKVGTNIQVIRVGQTIDSQYMYLPISFNDFVLQEDPNFIPAVNACNTVCTTYEGY